MSVLGKRRRQTAILRREKPPGIGSSVVENTEKDVSDIFRSYFEATFEPLPQSHEETLGDIEEDSGSDGDQDCGSEWSGFEEDVPTSANVQIVEYKTPELAERESTNSKKFKRIMTSEASPEPPDPLIATSTEVDRSEAINLKRDLDLQRLLAESHLLEQSNSLTASGAQRHKVSDLRMPSLGSKSSLFQQEKMPLSHRRGITSKAGLKETMRRKDALENGVILEKATTRSKKLGEQRERGVDAPGVGKFRDGTLRLSRRDIMDINGPSPSPNYHKSRRKR